MTGRIAVGVSVKIVRLFRLVVEAEESLEDPRPVTVTIEFEPHPAGESTVYRFAGVRDLALAVDRWPIDIDSIDVEPIRDSQWEKARWAIRLGRWSGIRFHSETFKEISS